MLPARGCRAVLPLLVACVLSASLAAAQVTVKLSGPRLSWQAGKTALGTTASWLSVRDVAAGEEFVSVPVSAQGLRYEGTVDGLRFAGEWRPASEGLELRCRVVAAPLRDQALIVRVSLPLSATGWTWWDDAQDRRVMETGKHYDRLARWWVGGRQMSVYPLAAVTGTNFGLSLAMPVDEPRAFRFACDTTRNALEAEFDLGLAAETAKFPGAADFRLFVYPHDPQWGFRDALRRYYQLFPDYAKRRMADAGIWLLGFNPTTMVCPWDFGLKFDEGAQYHTPYDGAHDILSFVYTEPWGKYENMGTARPTVDGKPRYGSKCQMMSREELKQTIVADLNAPESQHDRHFGNAPRRVIAQADVNSAIENREGVWTWEHWTNEWSSDGSWISDLLLNPDPDLVKPNRASVAWDYELDPAFAVAHKAGAELSGIYLDSISAFIGFYDENYRREHWRAADVPLTFSYESKQPVQLHAFANWEFHRDVTDRMHAQGKFVIGNTGRPEMQPFCARLDMIGAGETRMCGLTGDEHYRFLRAYGYSKPISWMDYSFVNPKVAWEDRERGLQRCLFYAVHPGTGPFDKPAGYEVARPLFRFYEPLIIWLDQAGWQPATQAIADPPEVAVERYGPGAAPLDQVSFLALRNPGKLAVETTLTVAAPALPASCQGTKATQTGAWQVVSDRPATVQVQGKSGGLKVTGLVLAPDSTEVLVLGTREAIARLWLAQTQRWLDRTAREGQWLQVAGKTLLANGDFELGLAGWGAASGVNQRESELTLDATTPLGGKQSVLATSTSDRGLHGLHHDCPLPGGDEYTLSFRYAWTRPEGAKGSFYPRFGVKGPEGTWDASKYVYFRDLKPTDGQVAVFERKFTIPVDCSAGFFQFMFEGNWGTLRIDDVQLTSERHAQAQRDSLALCQEATTAAKSLLTKLAAKSGTDLTALAAAQLPTYDRLRQLCQSLPDERTRRGLLLPARNAADTAGRALEVLTGLTLTGPEGRPFLSGAAGLPATLPVALTASQSATPKLTVELEGAALGRVVEPLKAGGVAQVPLTADLPGEAVGGWVDCPVRVSTTVGKQSVSFLRLLTVRLQPPLQVGATGPLSTISKALPVAITSLLPEAVKVTGTLTGAGEAVALGEREATGAAWAVPETLRGQLDTLAAQNQKLALNWQALVGNRPLTGTTELALARGVQCPLLATAPKLDGQLAPGEWDAAARLGGFVYYESGKPAPRATTVWVGRDSARLYVAFRCDGQTNLKAPTRPLDGSVYEDDAVEVFLQPGGAGAYYHLAVNAAGARLDGRCEAGENLGWNGDWQAQTGQVEGGWVVELSVSLASLQGSANGEWRANFCREEADTKTATAWNPTPGGFHKPGQFGVLGF